MPRNLFFVDSIYRPGAWDSEGESRQEKDGDVFVSLIPTEGDNGEGQSEVPFVVSLKSHQLQMKHRKGEIQEGWYVYFTPDNPYEGRVFSYGNQTEYAQNQKKRSAELRRALLQNSTLEGGETWSEDTLHDYEYGSDVISYHVNVGHGNCSFILILNRQGYDLWAVDCSRFERAYGQTKWVDHKDQIDRCLEEISYCIAKLKGIKISRANLRISRFFLTHTHHDHYNGIEYLQSEGYIDSDTKFYLNIHYECASSLMNRILERIKNGGNKIVEPIASNGSDILEILHPECRIVRSHLSKITDTPKPRIVNKVNNSSVVYRINLGMSSMTFSGDLEQAGFDVMIRNGNLPICCDTDYYVISHHGSANGHPKYISGHKRLHRRRLGCLRNAIIMGRNGAYSGIYDSKVINCFDMFTSIVYTEKDDNFQPIDAFGLHWESGKIRYLY